MKNKSNLSASLTLNKKRVLSLTQSRKVSKRMDNTTTWTTTNITIF